jgi:uncharacterized membrane protein
MSASGAAGNTGSSIYHIVLFSFVGAGRAGEVLDELENAQQLAGYNIVAHAVVERDAAGKVHVHEPGRGGVAGTAGAVAGGLLGLFAGPLGVILLATAGGVLGGLAGHFAGRAIPAEDLKRLGDALPPDSSGLVVLAEDTEAERLVGGLKEYQANVVTVTVGDELSGEIDTAVAAQLTAAGSGSGGTPATPAAPAAPPAAGSGSGGNTPAS